MGVSLKYLVDEADLVLIGIGEEWGFKPDYLKDDVIKKDLENGKDYEWLYPYIEYEYLTKKYSDNRLENYKKLRNIIGEKEYFLVSTLHDSLALEAGFSLKNSVFPCGNFNYLQGVSNDTGRLYKADEIPCFDKICAQVDQYLNHEIEIFDIEKPIFNNELIIFNQKIPDLRNEIYNESAYLSNWQIYMDWLSSTLNKRLLILELGVGMLYPTVIRFPFEKLTYLNKRARMIRVHDKLYQLTKEISEKSQGVQMNSIDFIMQESDG